MRDSVGYARIPNASKTMVNMDTDKKLMKSHSSIMTSKHPLSATVRKMSSGRRKSIFTVLVKPEEEKNATDRLNHKMLMKSVKRHKSRNDLRNRIKDFPMTLFKLKIRAKLTEA